MRFLPVVVVCLLSAASSAAASPALGGWSTVVYGLQFFPTVSPLFPPQVVSTGSAFNTTPGTYFCCYRCNTGMCQNVWSGTPAEVISANHNQMQCAQTFAIGTIMLPPAFDFGVAYDVACTQMVANWTAAYNPNGVGTALSPGLISTSQWFIQPYQSQITYSLTMAPGSCSPQPACNYQFSASTWYICSWNIYNGAANPVVPWTPHESGITNFTVTSATTGTCAFPGYQNLPSTQQVPFQLNFQIIGLDGFAAAASSTPNLNQATTWTFWNNVALASVSPTTISCSEGALVNINVQLTAALPLTETVSNIQLQQYQVLENTFFQPVQLSADLKTLTCPYNCPNLPTNRPPFVGPLMVFVTDQLSHEYDVVGINGNTIAITYPASAPGATPLAMLVLGTGAGLLVWCV